MTKKSLADIVDLRSMVETILRDYAGQDLSKEKIRLEIADKVYERYSNLIKEITTKFLDKLATQRSTIQTFQQIGDLSKGKVKK